jgi:hypothetical protein
LQNRHRKQAVPSDLDTRLAALNSKIEAALRE